MPDLMISPTPMPAPTPNTPGRPDALGQSEAARASGKTEQADQESGSEPPFAAVLKSQMAKQTSDGDGASKASSAPTTAQTDAEKLAISIDLAALFPLLSGNAGAPANLAPPTAATTEAAAPIRDEKQLPEIQPATEQTPVPLVAALSPAPIMAGATDAKKPGAEAREETVAAAASRSTAVADQTPGKIALDPAITADPGHKSAEKSAPEPTASDFHALIERAGAMTPGATNPANSPAPGQGMRIDTPLGQAGWHDEMGQKLTWMVGNNRQQADIVLTPPNLGRVEVSLTMNGDQATAVFTSPHAAVREALEASLHRLREVLADAGVSLGQTHVGSESPNQSSSRNTADSGMREGVRYAVDFPAPVAAPITRTSVGRSMIDVFA
jgi:flagellar hook-length control protein FliK